MQLSDLRALGRSGLPVSPFALGTMTFGNTAWGSADDVSETIFNKYVDDGGNFIDTADVYAGGKSEELVGRLIQQRKLRDKLVLATKSGFSGGNGRKNIHRAVNGSLSRLGTDYIDLYWIHVWDGITPADEVLETLVGLVRDGKIRYFALSDTPAWYAARMHTLAEQQHVPGPVALQLAYSLAERGIEQEYFPLAKEVGLGVVPWSPLAFGLLTGKYTRGENNKAVAASGRLSDQNSMFQMFTAQTWDVVDMLRQVSESVGKTMAEVALAWVLQRPGVTSTILGASSVEQLQQNLGTLSLTLAPEALARLDQASAPAAAFPYSMFNDDRRKMIFGNKIEGWVRH